MIISSSWIGFHVLLIKTRQHRVLMKPLFHLPSRYSFPIRSQTRAARWKPWPWSFTLPTTETKMFTKLWLLLNMLVSKFNWLRIFRWVFPTKPLNLSTWTLLERFLSWKLPILDLLPPSKLLRQVKQTEVEEVQEEAPKPKNPLDLLPPSKTILDDMKLYEWTKVDISDEVQKERVSQMKMLNHLRERLFWMPSALSENQFQEYGFVITFW